ncbi:MAG: hypothetical protein IH886_17115 [Nitrospinae bacterium]|nr:hypothetical protein [Nitrospinota bacterium]
MKGNIGIVKYSIIFVGILISGCTVAPIIEIPRADSGCTNVLPPPSLQKNNIDIGIANEIVSQIPIGKLEAKYYPTFERLLSDSTLNKWVIEEVHCQISKNFNDKNYQLWFLTMKTVSEKESPEEFIKWLEKNPPESFRPEQKKFEQLEKQGVESNAGFQETEDPQVIEIVAVYGELKIPYMKNRVFQVNIIGIDGKLIIPGPSKVVIGKCYGKILQNPKATVIIIYSGPDCSQKNL